MDWYKCSECGRRAVYRAESETWKTRCFFCWKEGEGIEFSASDLYAMHLEDVIFELKDELLKTDKILNSDQLKALISLVHPDKHEGSEKATKATQLLLQMREGAE